MMHYLLILLIGYLLGCSNMAVYLAAAQNIDLRSGGSGNPGASNALILMGWRAGLLVGAHDIAKAVLAVLLCRLLFPTVPLAGALSGAACVAGHMFPFYMRFHGGKGFAAYLGMTLALNWRFALLLLLAVSLITLVTDYVVLGTMTTVISVPLYSAWSGSGTTALLLLPLSAIIIYKHRDNLVRICRGDRDRAAQRPPRRPPQKHAERTTAPVGAFARWSAAAIQKASEKGSERPFSDAFFVSSRAAVSLSRTPGAASRGRRARRLTLCTGAVRRSPCRPAGRGSSRPCASAGNKDPRRRGK